MTQKELREMIIESNTSEGQTVEVIFDKDKMFFDAETGIMSIQLIKAINTYCEEHSVSYSFLTPVIGVNEKGILTITLEEFEC